MGATNEIYIHLNMNIFCEAGVVCWQDSALLRAATLGHCVVVNALEIDSSGFWSPKPPKWLLTLRKSCPNTSGMT